MPQPLPRSAADYLAALKALMPRGAVWPRDAGSGQGKVLAGIAETAARLRARADHLLTDAFPATAYELLPEWEETLGLPDPCAGPAPTLQHRRLQVAARLSARGGQSVPYLVARAEALGFIIQIREFAPSRMGFMRMGSPMRDAPWAHAWSIEVAADTPRPFRLGQSTLGERFRTWGNAVLECEMRAAAPAHTALHFTYLTAP